jgi:DNA-binding NtrC family response regulator
MDATGSFNVLIVEDDTRTRDLLRVGLDTFPSFAVDSVEPGWAADSVRDRSFDLILLNTETPGSTDGLDLVQQIREIDPRPEFILLTRGRSSRFLSSQKNANNIFAFLTLPLDVPTFFKTIARARDRIGEKLPARR